MRIEPAEWDSQFLGLKVGKSILGKEVEEELGIENKWDLIYFFVDPTNSRVNNYLKTQNAQLVDRKRTYLVNVKNLKTPSPSSNISPYKSGTDDEKVIHLGTQSGIYSRFNEDPLFGKENYKSLYQQWMKRSIDKEMANEVYVYNNEDGKPVGVITLRNLPARADIGILAVDEKYRGKNIGSALVDSAITYTKEEGFEELQVVTQGANEGACKFYENAGFHLESEINVYHYWKKS